MAQVRVGGVAAPVLRALIEATYAGRVDVAGASVWELAEAADQLQVGRLMGDDA